MYKGCICTGLVFAIFSSFVNSDVPIRVDPLGAPPQPPSLTVGGSISKSSYSEEHHWLDLNYILCDGLGFSASGKVKVVIELDRLSDRRTNVKSLSVFTSYPHHDQSTAKVTFTAAPGDRQTINLVRPWWSTIGPSNLQQLVLPRVSTDSARLPDREGMILTVQNGSKIKIQTAVMFPAFGPGCVGTSEKDIPIK